MAPRAEVAPNYGRHDVGLQARDIVVALPLIGRTISAPPVEPTGLGRPTVSLPVARRKGGRRGRRKSIVAQVALSAPPLRGRIIDVRKRDAGRGRDGGRAVSTRARRSPSGPVFSVG